MVATTNSSTLLSERIAKCLAEMPGVASIEQSHELQPLYDSAGHLLQAEGVTRINLKAERKNFMGVMLFGKYVGWDHKVVGNQNVENWLSDYMNVKNVGWLNAPTMVHIDYLRYEDFGAGHKGLSLAWLTNSKYGPPQVASHMIAPNAWAAEQVYIRVK